MLEEKYVENDVIRIIAKLTQLVNNVSECCELVSFKTLGKSQQSIKTIFKVDVKKSNFSKKMALDPFKCLKSFVLGYLERNF